MTSDDIAHCQSALEAAAANVISSLKVLEKSAPNSFSTVNACAATTSGVGAETAQKVSSAGKGYTVFVSSTSSSLDVERDHVWQMIRHYCSLHFYFDQLEKTKDLIIDFGLATHGKTTSADLFKGLYGESFHHKTNSLLAAVLGESHEEKAMNDFVEHAVIGYLSNGDAVGLAKLNAALPEDNAYVIEVPHMERTDAAIYADSILAYNGRSLDSHNPWHLTQSFEDYLAAETDPSDPARPIMEPSHAGIPSPAHPSEAGVQEVLKEPYGFEDIAYIGGKGHNQQNEISRILVCLTSAMHTLFDRPDVVHRDIKPENILLLK